MSEIGTFFIDKETGKIIASDDQLLSIPIREGMKITIHGYEDKEFAVVDWDYHHGHPDENAGLRIYVKKTEPFEFVQIRVT